MSTNTPPSSFPPGAPGDEELVNALIWGNLDADSRDQLLERMKTDAVLRDLYGSMVEMEAMLHHEFPRLVEFREPAPLVRRPKRRAYNGWFRESESMDSGKWRVLAGIAAVLVALFVGWFYLREEPGPILVEAYGEGYWLDGGGRRVPLVTGQPMPRGSVLMTEGEGTHVKLRFSDGSKAILSGNGELRFRHEKSKKLLLGRGNLEVEMSKQPEGRPAYVETATARIEVIGTRFSIDATTDSTTVAVSEGKVKLSRLADNRGLEISGGWMATVSLDVRSQFDARPLPDAVPLWKASIASGDEFDVKPFRAGSYRDGRPIIHYGVWFRNEGAGSASGLVTLDKSSRFRVKFRAEKPEAYLRVFLVCRDGQERAVGNRQIQVRVSSLPEDALGWRTFEGAVSEMEALAPAGDFEIGGTRVVSLCVATLEPSDGLNISEVSIFN